ncbi:hypothetical protein V2J09_011513, partial [Rumex salicifolius]
SSSLSFFFLFPSHLSLSVVRCPSLNRKVRERRREQSGVQDAKGGLLKPIRMLMGSVQCDFVGGNF